MEEVPPKATLLQTVVDLSVPIPERMRAVFYLRSLGGSDSVEALCKSLKMKEGTVLYRHEIAYVLGQTQEAEAVPTLSEILDDVSDDSIVRHECAEALAAIGDPSALPILKKHKDDKAKEVSETCEIAIDKLEKAEKATGREKGNPFHSIDPAPAVLLSEDNKELEDGKMEQLSIPQLQKRLMDNSLPLYERYRAMFGLRNANNEDGVVALTTGLDDSSALFRHEVAYVLGQLAHPAAAEALSKKLQDKEEHPMVRHEAAEALGAIGDEPSLKILKEYAEDDEVIVRESCEVALDAADYWSK